MEKKFVFEMSHTTIDGEHSISLGSRLFLASIEEDNDDDDDGEGVHLHKKNHRTNEIFV